METVSNCVSREGADLFSPSRLDKPSPAAVLEPPRCQFTFEDGRRCRMRRWEAHPAFCITHAQAESDMSSSDDRRSQCHPEPGAMFERKSPAHAGPGKGRCDRFGRAFAVSKSSEGSAARPEDPPAMLNFAADLAPLSGEFKTATDVNRALGKVFLLLAQNRIPRRNAVALGYIAQLMLQTLPAVKEELINGRGYQAWTETLDSAFQDDEESDETEPEDESDEEASAGAPISALAAGTGCTCSPREQRPGCTCSPHRSTTRPVAPANPKVASESAEPQPDQVLAADESTAPRGSGLQPRHKQRALPGPSGPEEIPPAATRELKAHTMSDQTDTPTQTEANGVTQFLGAPISALAGFKLEVARESARSQPDQVLAVDETAAPRGSGLQPRHKPPASPGPLGPEEIPTALTRELKARTMSTQTDTPANGVTQFLGAPISALAGFQMLPEPTEAEAPSIGTTNTPPEKKPTEDISGPAVRPIYDWIPSPFGQLGKKRRSLFWASRNYPQPPPASSRPTVTAEVSPAK